jgi:hypothetical protein
MGSHYAYTITGVYARPPITRGKSTINSSRECPAIIQKHAQENDLDLLSLTGALCYFNRNTKQFTERVGTAFDAR